MSSEITITEISAHAEVRWQQRAHNGCPGPRTAWRESLPVPSGGLRGDEVRYHPGTDTALVRKDETLVTVIAVEDAKSSVRGAVRHLRRE